MSSQGHPILVQRASLQTDRSSENTMECTKSGVCVSVGVCESVCPLLFALRCAASRHVPEDGVP